MPQLKDPGICLILHKLSASDPADFFFVQLKAPEHKWEGMSRATLCSGELTASCWGLSGASFHFLQAEEGLHSRCPKDLVPSRGRNCQKHLASTRWKWVFDGQRKPQYISTAFPGGCFWRVPALCSGCSNSSCHSSCRSLRDLPNPRYSYKISLAYNRLGLHCTTRRHRISAEAETLSSLGKSASNFPTRQVCQSLGEAWANNGTWGFGCGHEPESADGNSGHALELDIL